MNIHIPSHAYSNVFLKVNFLLRNRENSSMQIVLVDNKEQKFVSDISDAINFELLCKWPYLILSDTNPNKDSSNMNSVRWSNLTNEVLWKKYEMVELDNIEDLEDKWREMFHRCLTRMIMKDDENEEVKSLKKQYQLLMIQDEIWQETKWYIESDWSHTKFDQFDMVMKVSRRTSMKLIEGWTQM